MMSKVVRGSLGIGPSGCVLVLILSVAGCGGGPVGAEGTYELSGTIEYEGNPIPAGTIMFVPAGGQPKNAAVGIAEITDGHYKTAPGRGVFGGSYTLRLTAHDDNPVPVPDADPSEGPTEQPTPLFPPESEMKVDLPKGQKTFDIKVANIVTPEAPKKRDPRDD
jgi:hypothetical protein